MLTLTGKPPTLIRSEDHAVEIAEENQKHDPDWEYRVVRKGKYFAIEIYDELSLPVGYL